MNRRAVLAASLVALTEMGFLKKVAASQTCTTGNCSGNQTCCDGWTCQPTGNGNSHVCVSEDISNIPCEEHDQCPDDGVCHEGQCCIAYNQYIVVDGAPEITIIYVPITITVPITTPAPAPAPVPHHKRKRRHRRNRH